MNKELEETKIVLQEFINSRFKISNLNKTNKIKREEKAVRVALNYIGNSISKEVIKEKIEELEKSQKRVKNNNLIYSREDIFRFQIYILEELLEEK